MSLLNVSTTPDPLGSIGIIYELSKESYITLVQHSDTPHHQPKQPITGFYNRNSALLPIHQHAVARNLLSPLEFTAAEAQNLCHIQRLNSHTAPEGPGSGDASTLIAFYPSAVVIRLPRRGDYRTRNTLTTASLPNYLTPDEFFAFLTPTDNDPTPLSRLKPFQLPYDFRKDY